MARERDELGVPAARFLFDIAEQIVHRAVDGVEPSENILRAAAQVVPGEIFALFGGECGEFLREVGVTLDPRVAKE